MEKIKSDEKVLGPKEIFTTPETPPEDIMKESYSRSKVWEAVDRGEAEAKFEPLDSRQPDKVTIIEKKTGRVLLFEDLIEMRRNMNKLSELEMIMQRERDYKNKKVKEN